MSRVSNYPLLVQNKKKKKIFLLWAVIFSSLNKEKFINYRMDYRYKGNGILIINEIENNTKNFFFKYSIHFVY